MVGCVLKRGCGSGSEFENEVGSGTVTGFWIYLDPDPVLRNLVGSGPKSEHLVLKFLVELYKLGWIRIWFYIVGRIRIRFLSQRSDPLFSRRSDPGKTHPDPQPRVKLKVSKGKLHPVKYRFLSLKVLPNEIRFFVQIWTDCSAAFCQILEQEWRYKNGVFSFKLKTTNIKIKPERNSSLNHFVQQYIVLLSFSFFYFSL